MDPTEILSVRFHLGGEFIGNGPTLQYVGGDEEMSFIERDKLSLQEVKGFLKDHMPLKESMKFYFLVPGKTLADGLIFLNDDIRCVQMADFVCVGGVADIFVEYHGEEDSDASDSGSDFEKDEFLNISDDELPNMVITADATEVSDDEDQFVENVLVPDDSGVITQIIRSPLKQASRRSRATAEEIADAVQGTHDPYSQVFDPSQVAAEAQQADHQMPAVGTGQGRNDSSDSESDTEYVPHSDDSGENSEVVELRRHARKFKKKMKDTKSWIGTDSSAAIPLELIANMEEQLAAEERDWDFDSSDEDYSYDEDSDGRTVRRKSQFPRYNNDTEIPHFSLTMVFRSKNQLVKALRRYGIVTKRSIEFKKSAPPSHLARSAQAAVPSHPAATAQPGAFKHPRRTATTHVGEGQQPGAKRAKKRAPASSYESYKYFNASGNV